MSIGECAVVEVVFLKKGDVGLSNMVVEEEANSGISVVFRKKKGKMW